MAVPGGGPLLEVRDLRVAFRCRGAPDTVAVDGLGLDVAAGHVVGLVGETGCGKSVTAAALLRLLPPRGVTVTGRVTFDGVDLLTLSGRQMRACRGRDLSMIDGHPRSGLNPVIPIGRQITEVLTRHRGTARKPARAAAVELLDRVGIPARHVGSRPHELSDGARQRVLIAAALAGRPRLLIADEPTAGLDRTVAAQIHELLHELVRENGLALLMITRDPAVAAGLCETVNVLYGGRIVERAQRHRLFGTPRHPYTDGLLRSIPRLDGPAGVELATIGGSVADNLPWAQACAFAPRCPRALDLCACVPPVPDTTGGRLLSCHNPVPASVE